MTAGSMPPPATTGGTVFEVERFEWTAPDRLELAGRWFGVRGLRFVRPTLSLRGAEVHRRLLADLEHKPWNPSDGELWLAVFPWHGEPVAADTAELAVAPSIAVDLPAPRAPGKRRAKREPSPQRAAAAREAAGRERAVLEHERDEARRDRERALRERDAAMEARDIALREREAVEPSESARDDGRLIAALGALDERTAERDEARAKARQLLTRLQDVRAERDAAIGERDAALGRLATLEAERNTALAQAAQLADVAKAAQIERDAAVAERPSAVPTAPRQPARHSALALWAPRLAALGAMVALVVTLALLLRGI